MDTQPKRMSSSGVWLENQAGELLIVKANYKDYWTVPGGVIDEGETPKQAAIRETSEEVGLAVNADDLSFVVVADRISRAAQTYQFIFKATLPSPLQEIKLQKSEIDDFTFVTQEQVLSSDRRYAKAILSWANNVTGYVEQTFDRDKEGLE